MTHAAKLEQRAADIALSYPERIKALSELYFMYQYSLQAFGYVRQIQRLAIAAHEQEEKTIASD